MRRSGYLSPLFRFSINCDFATCKYWAASSSLPACSALTACSVSQIGSRGEVFFFSDMNISVQTPCRIACRLTVAKSVFQALLTPMICLIFLQVQHNWLGIHDVYPWWNRLCQNQGTQRWLRFFPPCCLAQRQLLFCRHLFCNSDSNYRHFF